jgi:hypothetical protein
MKRALLVVTLLANCASRAQEPQLLCIVPGHFDAFTTDELGHVYALQGDLLLMYRPPCTEWMRNSVKTLGRIGQIDAFYSLKPLLHAPEQGKMAVLDNTLSIQGDVLNLQAKGWPQVTLVCASTQNAFWLFDERELSLVRVDAALRPLANSGRLDQLLGFAPHPKSMLEFGNRLYVNDAQEGILVFDLFGTYMSTVPLAAVEHFEVRENTIYFVRQEGLFRYDLRALTETPMPLPAGGARNARLERDRLFVMYADDIRVYALQGPKE